MLAKACALANVDCENLGVAVWGHSQGGLVALGGANVAVGAGGNHFIRAAWLAGVGVLAASDLPGTRRRVVNGAGEWFGDNNKPATLISLTGATPPGDCPGQPSSQCLRADGSGWALVSKVQGLIGDDHCWFQANGCSANKTPAAGFIDPTSTAPYALERNADWIAATTSTSW